LEASSSVATLERTGVVITLITVEAMMAAGKIRQSGTGE
jgi:hypothetical protein